GSTGDKTFWAKWEPVSYAISYNLNGGSNAAGNPAAYTIETANITLAAPSRADYYFGGWFDNEKFSGRAVTSIPQKSTGNKSFWAKWTPTYKVTYYPNGGSGSVDQSVHVMGGSNVLASNGFTRSDYVFAGWTTSSGDGAGTLYWAGRGVPDLASRPGAEVTLYARWLPKEQTIELADSPARKSGHNTANALLWQFFPERNEFVIFAGQDYKSKTDSTVYVTGRTTVNRIRVLPGRSLNNWADVPGYSPSGAYAHNQWQNALWADWPLIFPDLLTGPTSGYVSGQVIPKPVLLGQIYNAHQIRIIFVNAEIEIPSVQGENSRSPLDIGPYHTFWKDNSWEGDFYKSTLGSDLLNDHEIDASIEFFEGENKLYTPSSPGISLWDSRKQGYAYVNEIPWQPDSDSYDSWKTKENISHWKSYAIKCVTFARNWGYPLDYSPHDGSIETGPGVVGHRFQSFGWGPSFLDVTFRGGSLNASNGASGVVELSAGGYKIIPSTGNAWTRRTTTK
ncbi:MAG: InlB B-repeat-containing protein, partial [Treponema sp.]|nr:InlB B-repeat-containing protein [Treponema sp.]